jgi:hypothetical protein
MPPAASNFFPSRFVRIHIYIYLFTKTDRFTRNVSCFPGALLWSRYESWNRAVIKSCYFYSLILISHLVYSHRENYLHNICIIVILSHLSLAKSETLAMSMSTRIFSATFIFRANWGNKVCLGVKSIKLRFTKPMKLYAVASRRNTKVNILWPPCKKEARVVIWSLISASSDEENQ